MAYESSPLPWGGESQAAREAMSAHVAEADRARALLRIACPNGGRDHNGCDVCDSMNAEVFAYALRLAADDEREACARLVERWRFYTVAARGADNDTREVTEMIVNLRMTDPLARAIRER
jgi:hypothetical protein